MPGKHGPNRLANYLEVHESCMADLLAEGFVIQDDCRFTFLPRAIILEGTVICLDGVTLEVHKEIEILRGKGPAAIVRTRRFRYHAWVRGVHNIFRYDSPHRHRPYPHKHVYDTFGYGGETDIVEIQDPEQVPTMAEVIWELKAWHESSVERLPLLR